MATYQSGNRRRATTNSVTAAERSAQHRQCPKCGRKSALVRWPEERVTYCRWMLEKPPKCDYQIKWTRTLDA